MPELSNIQTYEKLIGDNYQETFDRFSKVLQNIGLWTDEVKQAFDSFEWKVENNGFIYSPADIGYFKTKYSDIHVRPLVMIYTTAINKTFLDNWVVCELLLESESLRSFTTGNFHKPTYQLIQKLTTEMAKEFSQTGIYFTDESQDGEDFDGVRTGKIEKLWHFDYALIPKSLEQLYSTPPPTTFQTKQLDNFIEAWRIDRWTPNQE